MKIIFALLLSLLFFGFNNLSAAEIRPLVFATDATSPPFESYDSATDSLTGYDVDIANALCKQMLRPCKFTYAPMSELLKGLSQGKYDAVIRALSITPARLKLVDFTNPYYDTNGSFVAAVASDIDLSPGKLANSHIGVQTGTTFEAYLNAKYKNLVTIRSYQHLEEALADLSSNQINLVLGDTPVVKNWLAGQNPGAFKIVGVTAEDKEIFGTGFGIAVRKNNKALLTALNTALAQIKKNGTYAKITQTYFE